MTAGSKSIPADPPTLLLLDEVGGVAIGKKCDVLVLGQPFDSGNMVTVLVSDENCIDVRDRQADVGQHPSNAPAAETCIDQDAALSCLQHGTVAIAAAAEDVKLHCHINTQALR